MKRRIIFGLKTATALGAVITACIAIADVAGNDGTTAAALAITALLTIVAIGGATFGIRASRSNQHGMAAIGLALTALAPTFFFYIFNVILIALVVVELVTWHQVKNPSPQPMQQGAGS